MGNEAEERLMLARAGAPEARDEFIGAYTPFVLRVASRVCGRYLVQGRDDEVSVALIAFNEAIDRFNGDGGASFLTFAEMVIRRRLIDHFRTSGRQREVPLAEFEAEDDEGQTYNAAEVRGALDQYEADQDALRRRDDILQYQKQLARYGLSFRELAKVAPRHEDARRRAMEVARRVADTRSYADHLRKHHSLPMKALAAEADIGVSRKTLDRQRKYIIAVAVILMENLDGLREYVKC